MNPSSRFAPLVLVCAALLGGCETTPPVTTPPPEQPAQVEAPPATPPAPVEPEAQPQSPPSPPTAVVVKEPDPVPEPKVVCNAPPPKPEPEGPQRPASVLPILGSHEIVTVEPPGTQLKARLDTGASVSTLDARTVREFERDGKPWVKFVIVDRASSAQTEVSRPLIRTVSAKNGARRHVVSLRVRLGGIDQFTEFVLADRSAHATPVLLGHNFLRDQALVDVAHRYTVQAEKP